MQYSLEDMVAFAIRYHPFILELELQKGGALNYYDDNGDYVLEYPDGRIQKTELPVLNPDTEICPD